MPAWPLRTGGGAVGGIVGKIPEPEECMATEDRMQSVLDSSKNLPPKVRDYVQRNAAERRQSSIEVRNVDKYVISDILYAEGWSTDTDPLPFTLTSERKWEILSARNEVKVHNRLTGSVRELPSRRIQHSRK